MKLLPKKKGNARKKYRRKSMKKQKGRQQQRKQAQAKSWRPGKMKKGSQEWEVSRMQ